MTRSVSLISQDDICSISSVFPDRPASTLPGLCREQFLFMICTGLISGITSRLCMYPNETTSRVFNAMEGFCGGLLSAHCRRLFHTTPIAGEVASLSVIFFANRNRIERLDCSSKRKQQYMHSSLFGGLGSFIGAHVGRYMMPSSSPEPVKLTTSIAISIVGSFLGRKLADSLHR